MKEYESFDDYVRSTLVPNEPTELTCISPEEQKKKFVSITIDELINIWNEMTELKTENEKLKSVAEFQQASNMNRHFENKKLKEVLTVGSIFNKGLNSRNKFLEEEIEKYRNMVFDKMEMLDKAIEIIKNLLLKLKNEDSEYIFALKHIHTVLIKAEQFLEEANKRQ